MSSEILPKLLLEYDQKKRKAEIELEIEAAMKDKYEFVEYSKICRFIDDVKK